MSRAVIVLASSLALTAGVSALAADRPATTPGYITLGGQNVLDACSSVARVTGLSARGDNFLAVKAGPSLGAKRIDKLGPGAEVYYCEASRDGAWVSIVYQSDGKLSDRCGVSTPIPVRRRYTGPCLSGWVSAKYLKIIAG